MPTGGPPVPVSREWSRQYQASAARTAHADAPFPCPEGYPLRWSSSPPIFNFRRQAQRSIFLTYASRIILGEACRPKEIQARGQDQTAQRPAGGVPIRIGTRRSASQAEGDGEEELQRIRRRCQAKMEEIAEKIRAAPGGKLESLKEWCAPFFCTSRHKNKFIYSGHDQV